MHALAAGGRSARVRFRPRPIKLVIIETPFPDISGHVFDSKWTGAKRERTDRRTFRITVIDFAIAPGKNGVAIRKIGEIAAAVIISPREFALVFSFGRVLPFRFGGQTIFSAFARAQPLAKFHGIEITHVHDGMAIPRAGSPLGLVRTIELLVLGVGDQASRDIKAALGNMRKRTLIWRGVLRVTSHCEFDGWNKDHHPTERICEIAVTRAFQLWVVPDLYRRRLSLNWSLRRIRLSFSARCRRGRRSCERFVVRFFQVTIDQILGLARVEPEVFRHVDEGVALIVT